MDDGIISIDADKINYVILALVRNILDINKHAEIEISAYTDKTYLYIGITVQMPNSSAKPRTAG